MRDVLAMKVSFQVNTWASVSEKEPTVGDVLKSIKNGEYKKQVEELRSLLKNGEHNKYIEEKKKLPAVTFSATFREQRNKNNLRTYNSLIVLDIDKLTEEEMKYYGKHLSSDKYILSLWKSPSNNGFKGLVKVQFTCIEENVEIMHKSAFDKLSTYFSDTYKVTLDNSGSDITRLCFVSYDEDLVQNEKSICFPVTDFDVRKKVSDRGNNGQPQVKTHTTNRNILYNPLKKNIPQSRKIMSDIIRYLTKKNLSITHSYEEWIKVALAIANTFTYDIGLKYFIKLSKLDPDKFNEKNCESFLVNCYKNTNGNITFASIICFANKKGYKTKEQRDRERVPRAGI